MRFKKFWCIGVLNAENNVSSVSKIVIAMIVVIKMDISCHVSFSESDLVPTDKPLFKCVCSLHICISNYLTSSSLKSFHSL